MAGQMPVVVVPGGERQVDSEHHRPCPMALTALCHSAAAVSPGTLKTKRIGVAPLMAGQMSVVVVSLRSGWQPPVTH